MRRSSGLSNSAALPFHLLLINPAFPTPTHLASARVQVAT